MYTLISELHNKMAECDDNTDQNNIQNCPICIDTIQKQVSLPCLHSFCESCIGDYVASVCKGEPGLTSSFPCPSCRADTKLPCDLENIGSDVSSLAERFRINIQLGALKEPEKSDKLKTCTVCCVDRFKSVVATSWCQNCEEALCDTCTVYHRTLKVLKSHKVVQIENMYDVVPKSSTHRCPDHAMMDVTFYCFSHEQACCVHCAATKHRVCDYVDELEVLLQDPDFPSKNRKMQEELTRIQSDLCVVLQNRDRNAAQLGEEHLDIKEKITSLRNTVVKQVERMLSSTVSEAEDERRKESDTVRIDTDWLCDHQQLISGLLSKVQVASHESELDRFLVYRETQRNLATLNTELPEKLAVMCNSNLNFVPNDTICAFFQQFSKFGGITVKKENCKFQLSSDTARFHSYELAPVTSFSVSVSGEKTDPLIRTVLFVDDNKLLMSDIDNKSLKLYNDEGTLLQKVLTRGGLGFLTRMRGIKYAVTEPDICSIDVYEISNDITLISSTKTPVGILGIAFLNDVFILTGKDCVRVIEQNGECLQHLDKNSNGEPMFSLAKYILSDPSDNVVYVSDQGNQKVFAFKQHSVSKLLKQRPIHIYEHPQLKQPTGLAIDTFGNLLVCGCASGNVHLFDSEGRHLKIILSKVTNPLNLEWDSVYDRLVLSTNSPQYQIQFFKTI